MFDDTMLDDTGRLAADGSAELLRAAASSGAQIRATVEAAGETAGERFDGARPRALALVARPGVGAAAMDLLAEVLGQQAGIPVVRARTAPTWAGPLDVVFAYGDDPGDVPLAESLHAAGRRGAGVLVSADDEGPLAAAVAGYGALVPPRVPVPEGFGFPRALAAGLWLAGALGWRTTGMDTLAEALDVEAASAHPGKESFVNPAKSLAMRFADRTPLLWGLDPLAVAVARYARRCLAAHAGVVADAASYEEALARPSLRWAVTRATDEADIFSDPHEHAAEAGLVRLVLLDVLAGHETELRREAAVARFGGADVLAPSGELGEPGLDPVICAAVAALRCEMAALYLGAASGAGGRGGARRPDAVASA